MLIAFFQLVIGFAATLLGVLLLLRAWIWYRALPTSDPLFQLGFRTTNWLVRPLSRLVQPRDGWDWPSLLGAAVVAVLVVLSSRLLLGWPATPLSFVLAPVAMLLRWALEMISWGTLILAILSWLSPGNAVIYSLNSLLGPFLNPVRRVLPVWRGIDFSPLVVIVVANILLMFIVPVSQGRVIL